MFLMAIYSYTVDYYKDQINQSVVGDVSFGRCCTPGARLTA